MGKPIECSLHNRTRQKIMGHINVSVVYLEREENIIVLKGFPARPPKVVKWNAGTTVTVKRINLLVLIDTMSKAFDIRRGCAFPSMWNRGHSYSEFMS